MGASLTCPYLSRYRNPSSNLSSDHNNDQKYFPTIRSLLQNNQNSTKNDFSIKEASSKLLQQQEENNYNNTKQEYPADYSTNIPRFNLLEHKNYTRYPQTSIPHRLNTYRQENSYYERSIKCPATSTHQASSKSLQQHEENNNKNTSQEYPADYSTTIPRFNLLEHKNYPGYPQTSFPHRLNTYQHQNYNFGRSRNLECPATSTRQASSKLLQQKEENNNKNTSQECLDAANPSNAQQWNDRHMSPKCQTNFQWFTKEFSFVEQNELDVYLPKTTQLNTDSELKSFSKSSIGLQGKNLSRKRKLDLPQTSTNESQNETTMIPLHESTQNPRENIDKVNRTFASNVQPLYPGQFEGSIPQSIKTCLDLKLDDLNKYLKETPIQLTYPYTDLCSDTLKDKDSIKQESTTRQEIMQKLEDKIKKTRTDPPSVPKDIPAIRDKTECLDYLLDPRKTFDISQLFEKLKEIDIIKCHYYTQYSQKDGPCIFFPDHKQLPELITLLHRHENTKQNIFSHFSLNWYRISFELDSEKFTARKLRISELVFIQKEILRCSFRKNLFCMKNTHLKSEATDLNEFMPRFINFFKCVGTKW